MNDELKRLLKSYDEASLDATMAATAKDEANRQFINADNGRKAYERDIACLLFRNRGVGIYTLALDDRAVMFHVMLRPEGFGEVPHVTITEGNLL